MTRRRFRRRSGPGAALFGFAADGDITPSEVRDNPLLRPCRREHGGCGAAVSQHCTRPGRGGRVPIHGYHDARRPEGETTNV